jgi:DNA-binding transcriptional regulator LsrR (DeoR family)
MNAKSATPDRRKRWEQILTLYESGQYTHSTLAERFNITPRRIGFLIARARKQREIERSRRTKR